MHFIIIPVNKLDLMFNITLRQKRYGERNDNIYSVVEQQR